MVKHFFAQRIVLLLKVPIRRLQLCDLALQLRDLGLARGFPRSTFSGAPMVLDECVFEHRLCPCLRCVEDSCIDGSWQREQLLLSARLLR